MKTVLYTKNQLYFADQIFLQLQASQVGFIELCINMGTKALGNTTQSSNSQNKNIVMQHLSRSKNKNLAHMGI